MDDLNFEPVSPSAMGSPTGDTPPAAHDSVLRNFNKASHSIPPGATVYNPSAAPSTELNPRSCVTCRRRKVRCDKHMPCSNCRRAQISCIFPAPERAPRRPRRKDPNSIKPQSSERELELMKRLRKLEGIVEELSGQVELETTRNHSNSGDSPETASAAFGADMANAFIERAESISGGSNISHSSPLSTNAQGCKSTAGINTTGVGSTARDPRDVHKKFGRLVLNDSGRTRYVSSAFWSKINDELDQLRAETQRISEDDTDLSEAETSPDKDGGVEDTADHHAFIFGYRSSDVDLSGLHPLPSQVPYLWQVYLENVDPVVKILHIPSMNKLIRDLRTSMDRLTPATEALMFAIYYAATTSLEEDEIKVNFQSEKSTLIAKYRFALEQALAKAEFLTSADIVTLQAFLLFLIIVRRYDDTRFAWTLNGLIIRISQSIGLHRDGSNFSNLTPFEIEMRRRLWWAICTLDLRSAEDQGTDLTILDRTFDTQFPLNINDTDIDVDSISLPPARHGTTDLTFSLIRYEICSIARRLHTITSAMGSVCPKDAASSLREREQMIKEVHERVENKYLKDNTSESNAMYWVAANVARLIVAKMTLLIYQPVLFPAPGTDHLATETRERLFSAATEVFEYSHMLGADPRTKPWRWLFKTYTQWHAVAYTLMEVSRRPWSASVERAWSAMNAVFSDNSQSLDMEKLVGNTAVWVPFRRLYAKARKHRVAEIERLKSDPQAAVQLYFEDRATATPTTFSALSGSFKSAAWRDRWHKLVGEPPLPPLTTNPEPPSSNTGLSADPIASQGVDARASPLVQNDAAVTHFMDNVFAQQVVDMANLLPIAFSEGDDLNKTVPFGFGSADIPRQDATLAAFANNPPNAASDPSVGSGRLSPAVAVPGQSETPLVDAMLKDNPPPWLWGPYSQASQFGSVSDDMDVAMDDGIDWQNFGENLRGFEMQNGGGTGGIWSSHII